MGIRSRRRVLERGRLHVFDPAVLPELLAQVGYEQFVADARGGVVLFTVRKQ